MSISLKSSGYEMQMPLVLVSRLQERYSVAFQYRFEKVINEELQFLPCLKWQVDREKWN